jgi:hypothetical protein
LAILTVGVAACALGQPPASALDWDSLKHYLQPGVEILAEDATQLVLGLHGDPELRLVLTLEPMPESDVFASRERRGRTEYPVWEISERLWRDPERPRRIWSRFLRSEFWYVARPPRAERDPW